jgi:two-component system phosphate regulon sensor histidine kinase PhoR
MEERSLRDRILYFVLVPAIVLAVCVLGWLALRTTLQIERARRQTVLDATLTLATERVALLDNFIVAQDNVVATHADPAQLETISRRWLATAARETPSVRAILVLDLGAAAHDVLAFASKSPSREDDVFRRLLLNRLLPAMNYDGRVEELRHLHEVIDGRQYLVSYWQRERGPRTYMIVVWHDVDRIVGEIIPQLYRDPDRGNARMNVVDEQGSIVFGPPIKVGEFTVGLAFPTTLYNWRLQLALSSAEALEQQVERRRLIELAMVLVAGLVAVAGLIIVISASVKERRVAALKGDFVANVSHELKTPLSLIRMFGELLMLDRPMTEAKRKQYLQIIVAESERLTALIENVLDFSRVERGKAAYEFLEGDVGEVARRAAEIYRFRAERDGVEVRTFIPDVLPLARIDARALELAVMNLVDNALKYAHDGGEVDVEVSATGGELRLSVSDLGSGVPASEQPRIFERFFRGRSASSTRARGSGIGLSLVQHIADAHGGRVEVESPTRPDGRGARFTITLPASGPPVRRTPTPTASSSRPAAEASVASAPEAAHPDSEAEAAPSSPRPSGTTASEPRARGAAEPPPGDSPRDELAAKRDSGP